MNHVATKHSIRINTVTEPHVFPSRVSALDWLMKSGIFDEAFSTLNDLQQGMLLSGQAVTIPRETGKVPLLVKIVEMNNHGGEP